MWISSDEVTVCAEEDVFKIILTWVDRERLERKKYLAELFRKVRLVYTPRDYLHSDILTDDLVTENEGCMDLARDAMKFIDSGNYHHLDVKPTNSLETSVIVDCGKGSRTEEEILCYDPHENDWSSFPGKVPPDTSKVISSRGQLYFISQRENSLLGYDSFSNSWISLPYEEKGYYLMCLQEMKMKFTHCCPKRNYFVLSASLLCTQL